MNKLGKEVRYSMVLGVIFMVLYSAFYTLSNMQELILDSIHREVSDIRNDGFANLFLLYTSFALSIWFIPLLMSMIGPKWTLALGALGFCTPMVGLLLEQEWLLYSSSIFNGKGAAMIWTSQVVYIMFNSKPITVARNSAVFASICHSSMIYGNLFVYRYFCLADKTIIDMNTRNSVLIGLLGLTVLAMVMATLMPQPIYMKDHDMQGSAMQAITQACRLATSKNMLQLAPAFIYSGVQLAYLSGVYGAAVGFTHYSDGFPTNQLVSITGMSTGIGEVISGVFLFCVNPLLSSRTWPLVVLLGVISDCIAYILSFLIYANDSILHPTSSSTVMESRPWIAVVIAVLLGFSDGLFMPMLLSLMKKMYPVGNSSSSIVYTFWFSFGAAVSFFYSDFVGLYLQLLINAFVGIFGLLCYYYVNSVTCD